MFCEFGIRCALRLENLNEMLHSNYDIQPGAFSISNLETMEEEDVQLAGVVHRHKYFEIIFLMEGSMACQIDTEKHVLDAGHLCLIRPGKMHAMDPGSGVKGYSVSFAPEFFAVSLERSLLLNASSVFSFSDGDPVLVSGAIKMEILKLMRLMAREYHEPGLFKAEALRGLLKILFIYLSRLAKKEPPVRLNRKNQIVENFLSMLDEKFSTHRRPADYADALSVTTNYLNETVKTVSGFTTSYHIHQRVILEAKRMAVYSDESMKQVASKLGFDDVCHFSRFFKKASGQGFSEFKQKTLIGVM